MTGVGFLWPMRIAALLSDPAARARLRQAVGGAAELRFVDGCRALREAAAAGAEMIVLSPRDAGALSTAPLVTSLRAGFPSTPIVGYCEPGRADSHDLLALARAGIDALVLRGPDDLRGVLAPILARASQHRLASVVLRELEPDVPPRIRPALAHFLEHAAEPPTVEGTATALGVHRRTLLHRFTRSGWPPPGAVIGWTRLVTAAALLEDPGRTVERVALQLGFESGNALRSMLRRYTGLRPGELRGPGGLDRLLRLLRQAVGQPRRLGVRRRRTMAPRSPRAHFLQRPHP